LVGSFALMAVLSLFLLYLKQYKTRSVYKKTLNSIGPDFPRAGTVKNIRGNILPFAANKQSLADLVPFPHF
jgi:hypothetical protein